MENNINSPIAIGGMGGSGTRIVAQILIELGIFLGDELNKANDNLWFTRLFKDPIWFRKHNTKELNARLVIFEKLMTRRILNGKELKELYSASISNKTFHTRRSNLLKGLLKSITIRPLKKPWGWKEPNTHIYIKHLSNYFDNLKYIHVVRHGLDMAFSENQQQLINWGFLFDIDWSENIRPIYYHQLNYWIKSNKKVLEVARNSLGSQIYIVNYDQLCLNPSIEILELMRFLGFEISENEISKLIELIKPPKSFGRAEEKDLSIFTEEQMKEVEKLGFDLSSFRF